jgi:calcium-dependent protein kinase
MTSAETIRKQVKSMQDGLKAKLKEGIMD